MYVIHSWYYYPIYSHKHKSEDKQFYETKPTDGIVESYGVVENIKEIVGYTASVSFWDPTSFIYTQQIFVNHLNFDDYCADPKDSEKQRNMALLSWNFNVKKESDSKQIVT